MLGRVGRLSKTDTAQRLLNLCGAVLVTKDKYAGLVLRGTDYLHVDRGQLWILLGQPGQYGFQIHIAR